MHRKTMVIFREQGGPNTGNSGHVDSDDAEARPTAWLRHCAVNQANLGRFADRGIRFTLSGTTAIVAPGVGEGGVEDDRN
jgi:hypothetical protein